MTHCWGRSEHLISYGHMMCKVFPICRGVIVGDICSIQDVSIVKGLWTACERVFQFLNGLDSMRSSIFECTS